MQLLLANILLSNIGTNNIFNTALRLNLNFNRGIGFVDYVLCLGNTYLIYSIQRWATKNFNKKQIMSADNFKMLVQKVNIC